MNTHSQNSVPKPLPGNSQGLALHGVLAQLDATQWWDPQQMAAAQLQQLSSLLAHAVAHSPFYKHHLSAVDTASLSMEAFRELPLLTRALLQENNESIDCIELPKEHGSVTETMTSGSTGFPVKIRSTGLSHTLWSAINMREQLWHGRDFAKTSASIRWQADEIGLSAEGVEFEDWGMPSKLFFKTGKSYFLNSSSSTADQVAWLQRVQPSYLMTHPSNLRGLIEQLRRTNTTLQGLEELRTVGESIDEELRSDVAELFGVRLVDLYSSEELGYMAVQCPVQSHYHVQSESVLLEVLREDGSPCAMHEPGRIVVSSLRNYATPLIRYEIGDYGVLAGPCSCGRGLPVLKAVHGRVRNMLLHPDGSSRWPSFGFRKFAKVAALKQFQIVQHTLDEIEFRVVVGERLSERQEADMKAILQENLGHPFNVNISYHSELERSAGGKFEDFVSKISSNA